MTGGPGQEQTFLEARILGQLLLMQSVVSNLPDVASILRFVEKGLADVPGVSRVEARADPSGDVAPDAVVFPLEVGQRKKGMLILHVSDPAAFSPYTVYLRNFCFMLAVILEERRQRREIELYREELEERVKERTRRLEEEIAEREAAQYAMRKSQERLDLALMAVSDGLWDWNTVTGEVYYSPRWFTMLGYDAGALSPTYETWRSLLHPEDAVSAVARVSSCLETGEALHVEFRMRREDGGWTWVLSRGRVVEAGEDGRPRRMIGTHTDITERKHMLEMMIQSEKMLSVGGLAAGMAHEINNPLSGILQAAQVVRNRIDNASPVNVNAARESGCDFDNVKSYMTRRDIFKMLDNIQDAASRASHIVSNMLEFSRKSGTDKAQADLNVLLDKAVELSSSEYDLKKNYDFRRIDIVRRYDPDLPEVSCWPGQIQQVLLNLLGNAAHALAEVRTPRITLSTRTENGMVVLQVEDNGKGMDDTTRRQVFEPFFTTKALGEGTGLGLSVSYFIVVSNHKGTLDVSSVPGQGTVFTIRLPLEPGSDAGAHNPDARKRKPARKTQPPVIN